MSEYVLYVLVGLVVIWLVIIFWMIVKMTGNVRISEMADESLEKHLKAATAWLAEHEASADLSPALQERRQREEQRVAEIRAEIENRRNR